MFLVTSIRILYRATSKWSENGGMRMGAALAYYTVFSIAPLLLIAVHIAGAVFGEDVAKGKVHAQLQSFMGKEVYRDVETFFEVAGNREDTYWTPAVSFAFLVVAALGAFLHVRGALCNIWKLDPPTGKTWFGMFWDYALSLFMVFIVATLLLFSLACSVAVLILRRRMSSTEFYDDSYWEHIELAASFLFLTILFACMYRILSGGRIPWIYVWYGSFIAAVLFTVGKTVLSQYIVYTGAASMYGAAGSLVVFLMWIYYSSQVLFFGAELIQARRTRHEWMNGKEAQG